MLSSLASANGGDQVGGARSAGGHANADASGAAGVTLGGKTAALFVPGQNHPNLIAEPRQGLVQRHARAARISENRIHAMIYQGLHDDIGPAGDLAFVVELVEGDWPAADLELDTADTDFTYLFSAVKGTVASDNGNATTFVPRF